MLENKKVIIFDLDGTLIDSIGIWSEIDKKLVEKIGGHEDDIIKIFIERDKALEKFSKCEDAYLEYCGFLGKKYNSNLPKEEIKKIRYEIANDYLRNVVKYKDKAAECLKYLKSKGYTLVLASTTNDHTIDIYANENKSMMEEARITNIFSLILAKSAVKELKPNPAIHNKILKELGVKKEECLIFEDSLIGTQAGNSAGIDVAIMYDKNSDDNREEINKLAKYQFKDFEELLNKIKNELGD